MSATCIEFIYSEGVLYGYPCDVNLVGSFSNIRIDSLFCAKAFKIVARVIARH